MLVSGRVNKLKCDHLDLTKLQEAEFSRRPKKQFPLLRLVATWRYSCHGMNLQLSELSLEVNSSMAWTRCLLAKSRAAWLRQEDGTYR